MALWHSRGDLVPLSLCFTLLILLSLKRELCKVSNASSLCVFFQDIYIQQHEVFHNKIRAKVRISFNTKSFCLWKHLWNNVPCGINIYFYYTFILYLYMLHIWRVSSKNSMKPIQEEKACISNFLTVRIHATYAVLVLLFIWTYPHLNSLHITRYRGVKMGRLMDVNEKITLCTKES